MAKIVITSGGTKVPIDGVRHISNMSSGYFGSLLAIEAIKMGHEVVFIGAKHSVFPSVFRINLARNTSFAQQLEKLAARKQLIENAIIKGYRELYYTDFDDYCDVLKAELYNETLAHIVVLAAAVSDYAPVAEKGKIKSDNDEMTITLKKLPKVIDEVKKWSPESKLVGFKLLVDSSSTELAKAAFDQIERAGVDLVVANDLKTIKQGQREFLVCDKNGTATYIPPPDRKLSDEETASLLISRFLRLLK